MKSKKHREDIEIISQANCQNIGKTKSQLKPTMNDGKNNEGSTRVK